MSDQPLSAARALRELGRIPRVTHEASTTSLDVVTRRSPLQTRILTALGADTTGWDRARVN